MKTPIQELIEIIKKRKEDDEAMPFMYNDKIIALAESLLEKEKEVMYDAWLVAISNFRNDTFFEEYYNETFNTKEKMVEDEMDYKKEYYRLYQEVAEMLVENRRNYKTPMTPFELLLRWDEIREVKNTFNTK